MHIPESDAVELRKWIIKRLEAFEVGSDGDVLADFVIALLRTDVPEAQLRADAYKDLEDFLESNTRTLVDEFFKAVKTRSFLPDYVPPPISAPTPYNALPKPTRTAVPVDVNGSSQNGRKRSFTAAQEDGHGLDSHYARVDRQVKQMRGAGRGKGGDSRGRGGNAIDHSNMAKIFYSNSENTKLPLEGYPAPVFDSNDPFAAMAAFQAMGLPMPQMPQLLNPSKSRKPCRDYDTKGFCARGDSCHFQHGTDRIVFPKQDEYDPKNALFTSALSPPPHDNGPNSMMNGRTRGSGRGRGEGRGATQARRGNRADFSQAGPNNDHSIKTIVVEQIPEEKFEEQTVRDFFSEFGSIIEVTMQPYKRLALVKYDDYFAARRAYESPKVIFDNRFVKVYWYKPGTLPTPSSTAKVSANSPTQATPEEQPFDREEFERKAAEAQKKLEEKKGQMQEMAAKREALEKQKEELAHKQAEEKKKLLEKLATKKGATPDVDSNMTDAHTNGAPPEDESNVSASTKALRAKLAELEAEAKSLGIDNSAPEPYAPRGRGRGRGRGGSYRGWEGFAGRGSNDSYRGSPRGRGVFRGYGGGKYNLDLRTKKVSISGVEWTGERDEALRQFLTLGVGDFEAISQHPDHAADKTSLIISFNSRQTAESFFYGPKDIPGVGKVECNWYHAPVSASQPNGADKQKTAVPAANGQDGDVGMSGTGVNGDGATTAEYDVAEEDDRWD